MQLKKITTVFCTIFFSALLFAEAPTFPPTAVTGPFPSGSETVRDDSPVDTERPGDIKHEYTCYKVETPPVIDGNIDTDEVWAKISWTVMTWWELSEYAEEFSIFSPPAEPTHWTGFEDCTGYFKMLWDETNVYLAIEVIDDTYNAHTAPATPGDMHQADCLQFGLQTSETEATEPGDSDLGSEMGFGITNAGGDWEEMFYGWSGDWHAWSNVNLGLADGDNASGNESTNGKAIHASVETGESYSTYRFELAINLDDDNNWLDFIEDEAVVRMTICALDHDTGDYEDVNWGSGILTKSFQRLASVLFSGSAPSAIKNQDVVKLTSYKLSQNYPNPFNATTQIEYTIAEKEYVQLNVYNTIGQKVATLVNHEQTPNTYHVEFNAINLPSGVYFYKLVTNTRELTRKMMLLK
jgi:hypothetical protein